MVASVQSFQRSTANLNRLGFAAENEKKPEAAQPQAASQAAPKYKFVRNGAIAGTVVGLARMAHLEVKASVISNIYKCLLKEFPKSFAGSVTACSLIVGAGVFAGIGAGIGKIVKHFSKKD